MIRRRFELPSGEAEFRLITQDDHARLAGQLAAALGNEPFAPISGRRAILGVAMHDAGWPLHDEAPELSDQGLPADVFETTVQRGVTVWEASAARAEAADPYAGLLVSIHVHRLAARFDREEANLSNRERFWLIRFRNDQAQRQLRLRSALGLNSDRPLDHGLALPNDATAAADLGEQQLAFDFRILQAMDLLSLCICCTDPPVAEVALLERPGGAARALSVSRPSDGRLVVRPWPFGVGEIGMEVPYRAVPARRFDSAEDLHHELSQAEVGRFAVTVTPQAAGGL